MLKLLIVASGLICALLLVPACICANFFDLFRAPKMSPGFDKVDAWLKKHHVEGERYQDQLEEARRHLEQSGARMGEAERAAFEQLVGMLDSVDGRGCDEAGVARLRAIAAAVELDHKSVELPRLRVQKLVRKILNARKLDCEEAYELEFAYQHTQFTRHETYYLSSLIEGLLREAKYEWKQLKFGPEPSAFFEAVVNMPRPKVAKILRICWRYYGIGREPDVLANRKPGDPEEPERSLAEIIEITNERCRQYTSALAHLFNAAEFDAQTNGGAGQTYISRDFIVSYRNYSMCKSWLRRAEREAPRTATGTATPAKTTTTTTTS